jgi:peptidyl-prolyl cis-trans isomerase SurA
MRVSLRGYCSRIAAAFFLAFTGLALWQAGAAAQVQIVVNGDPITAHDIDQRSRLVLLSTKKSPPRQEVIEELIEEKLKLSVARFYKIDVTDQEVENSFNGIAQRMRASSQQFAQSLTQSGIHVPTFKQKLKADIGWQQIIRGKFGGDFQFREQDILAAAKGDEKDKIGYEYILRPILFIVPRGAPQSTIEARRREADALRTRFQSCDESLSFARALNDVAVRDQIVRSSADLAPALREILANVAVGKLTPPEMTPNGIEMFALCGKKENTADTPSKRAAREELINEKFQSQGKRYLKELRSKAMIEYKQ